MDPKDRIIQKAEKDIAYIGQNGNRNWGKSFKAGFMAAVNFTFDNMWIPVEEMLPEVGANMLSGYVLVYGEEPEFNSKGVDFGLYNAITNSWGTISVNLVVTHWCPIPKLIKSHEEKRVWKQ